MPRKIYAMIRREVTDTYIEVLASSLIEAKELGRVGNFTGCIATPQHISITCRPTIEQ
jgi:hypothetical protein